MPAKKPFVELSRFFPVPGGDFDVNNIPFTHDNLLRYKKIEFVNIIEHKFYEIKPSGERDCAISPIMRGEKGCRQERAEKWVGRVFRGKNVGKKGAQAQQVVYVKAISRGRSSRTGEQASKGQGCAG
jgi:hypothetical protein